MGSNPTPGAITVQYVELTKEIELLFDSNGQVRDIKQFRLRKAGPFIAGLLQIHGCREEVSPADVLGCHGAGEFDWERNRRIEKSYGEGYLSGLVQVSS